MYSVHAVVFKTQNGTTSRHEVLIHDTMSPVQEMHLIDPKLKIADSSAGSFSATIPPDNPGYSLVERFNSILKVYKGSDLLWTGRVLSENIDFWNRRAIGAEGALAFLNDSVQPIAYYGKGRSPAYILNQLLTIHNQKVVEDRKIYLGAVTDFSEDEYGSYVFETNNGNTWQEVQNNLLNRLDGHMFITYSNNKAYLNYYADWPNTASQSINFGDNLLDFTRNWNLSNIATVILPRGKALDADTSDGQKTYVNLKSSNDDSTAVSDGSYMDGKLTVDGLYLVNNELYSKYGRVEKVVDFGDSTTAQDLFTLSKNYILSMQFDELELNISAIDLHMLINEIPSFNLLDEVLCISQPHGMSKYFPIAEIDISLDHPENTKYTMSDHLVNSSMSGIFGKFKSEINNKFNSMATPGHILDLAKTEASSIINRKTTGYVSVINMFENEEEGVAQAIVISSSPDWRTANKYWIWNMNGLAYYSVSTSSQIAERQGTANQYAYGQLDDSNFEQPRYYDLAITMDGTIVANHIKTGILSDGYGYNYWNLETGDFRLSNSAKGTDYNGNTYYLNDVYDLAHDVDTRRTGASNRLNGTEDWAGWQHIGSWSLDSDNGQATYNGSFNTTNCLVSPNKDILYKSVMGFEMTFSFEGMSDDDWGEIASNNNSIHVYFNLVNSRQDVLAYQSRAFSLTRQWTRRYVSVEMIDSKFTFYNSISNYDNVYVSITFSNRSSHCITVRHFQFERGNIPTDWSVSDEDQNMYADVTAADKASEAGSSALTDAKTYVNEISRTDQAFTKNEIQAFDLALDQGKILERLTNGHSESGIYRENGVLLLNANYIRTGALDAGLIKAGIISENWNNPNNYWNLNTGKFQSKDGVFINANIDGQFTNGGNGDKVVIEDGKVKFYSGNRLAGWIGIEYMNGRNTMTLHSDTSLGVSVDRIDIDGHSGYGASILPGHKEDEWTCGWVITGWSSSGLTISQLELGLTREAGFITGFGLGPGGNTRDISFN